MLGKKMLGKSAVLKMAKKVSKPKIRNPYGLHAKQRKAGVHSDKRKTQKAKQKEEITALTEDELEIPNDLDEEYGENV